MGRRKKIAAGAGASAITLVVFAGLATMIASVGEGCCGAAAAAAMPADARVETPMVGEFAGTFVDGVPVYRLSPVTVAVSRKAELARIEHRATPPSPRAADLFTASQGFTVSDSTTRSSM